MASENKKFKNNGQSGSPKSVNSKNNINVKDIDKGYLIEQNFRNESNSENGKEIYNVENDPLGKILASFGLEVTEEDKNKNSKVISAQRSISIDSTIYIKELLSDNNENNHDIETDTFKTSNSDCTKIQPVTRKAKSKKGKAKGKKKAESYILSKDEIQSDSEEISNSPQLPTDNLEINDSSPIIEAPKLKTRIKKVQKESVTSLEVQRLKVIEGTPCQRTRSKKSLVQL